MIRNSLPGNKTREYITAVLEKRIFNNLVGPVQTFICSNQKDAYALRQLSKNFEIAIKTVVMKKHKRVDHLKEDKSRLKTSHFKELASQLGTWHVAFDLLEPIENDQVHNAILQFTEANNTVIFINADKAAHYAKKLNGKFCYDICGAGFSSKRNLRQLRVHRGMYLAPDYLQQLNDLEKEFSDLQNEEIEIEKNQEKIVGEITELKSVREELKGKRNSEISEQRFTQVNIDNKHKMVARIDQKHSSVLMNNLRQQLEDQTLALKQKQNQLNGQSGVETDAEREYKKFLDEKLEPMKNRKKEIEKQMTEVNKKLKGYRKGDEKMERGLNEKIRELEDKIKKFYRVTENDMERQMRKLEGIWADAERDYNDKYEDLIRCYEEIENPRDTDFLEREMIKIQGQIARLEECAEYSFDQISQNLFKINSKYQKNKTELKGKKDSRRELTKSVDRLENYLQNEKLTIAEQCECRFRYYCDKAGFSGRLKVTHADTDFNIYDHKMNYISDGEISFKVRPEKAQADMDARGLSGGERSYITVCFIITLWDMIDTPFKFLDEFDVFMDVKNREMAVNLLYEACRKDRNKNKQYFMLTPNDISSKEVIPNFDSKNCSVFKLKDPVRRAIGEVAEDVVDSVDGSEFGSDEEF